VKMFFHILLNGLNNWRNNMLLQMIELEEVQIFHVSDEALEATVKTGRGLYGTADTDCFCAT